MADSKPGTVADQDLDKHGSVPTPTPPSGNKSKDGELLDSTLSHIPPVVREF